MIFVGRKSQEWQDATKEVMMMASCHDGSDDGFVRSRSVHATVTKIVASTRTPSAVIFFFAEAGRTIRSTNC